MGEDVGAPKQKPPLYVLFSLCLLTERRKKNRDLGAKKGITVAVMTNDREMEQDLIQIRRVGCSRGSHSNVFFRSETGPLISSTGYHKLQING